MRVIRARNAHQMLPEVLYQLRQFGVRRDSRNGPVLRIPGPTCLEYERPTERVVFWPERDANPFFHILEAMWMLAGRNDVAYVSSIVSSMAQFSDNGVTFHGAYGYRWRNHWHIDQILAIALALKANPDCRRQVLAMWDAPEDLGATSKDIPCLAGDTSLWSPEGDIPIAQVAAKFASGEVTRWPVYAVRPDGWVLELSWATKVWRSGIRKTIKISFDDGSSIRVTPDHRLYRRGKSVSSSVEVTAQNLCVGDRVLATRRWYNSRGHEVVKRQLGENASFKNMQKTHQAYWGLANGAVPEGCVLHHENEEKTDNRLKNLRCLTKSEHDSLHHRGDRNPMRRLTAEQHATRAEKQSDSLKKNWSRLSVGDRKLRAKGLLVDNHCVVAIEEFAEEPVYDFEVPGQHTALVGTGVVVHNCNTHAYFSRDENGRLDMTVCNRSNDAVWGAVGANCVHFTVLQEFIAALIGCEVGRYWQVTNNFHLYLDKHEALMNQLAEIANTSEGLAAEDPYALGIVEPTPICPKNPERFDREMSFFLAEGMTLGVTDPFVRKVLVPVVLALMVMKRGEAPQKFTSAGLHLAALPEKSDWRLACEQWVGRRKQNWEKKCHTSI